MTDLARTERRHSYRHGLAADTRRSAEGTEHIARLKKALLGDGPVNEQKEALALAAAEGQYRVEQVQTIIDAVWRLAAQHARPLGLDGIFNGLELLEQSRAIAHRSQAEQLRYRINAHRLFTNEDEEELALAICIYSFRGLLGRLERYRTRAISMRSKAFDRLTAAELEEMSHEQAYPNL